jgi:hypothetical protein
MPQLAVERVDIVNCPECNAEIPRGWVRCAECGHMLEGSEWRGMMQREPRKNDLELSSVYSSSDFIMAIVLVLLLCGGVMFGIAKYNNSMDFAKNKIDVVIDVEPRLSEGQIEFVGTTNLPDGTDLTIILAGNDYRSELKATVADGNFVSSKKFSIDGQAIGAGTYTIQVLLPSALLQNDEIQKRIGKHGEMLTGQYVYKKPGELVKYEKTIEVN